MPLADADGAGPLSGTRRPVNACSLVCSISIYKSSQGCKKVRLQHFYTPDKSTVMSLACSPQGLYAGLVNGSVASYTKASGNHPHSADPWLQVSLTMGLVPPVSKPG